MKYLQSHGRQVSTSGEQARCALPPMAKSGKNGTQQHRSCSQAGFTLVEMLVVMGVFIIVIMIAGDSFIRILKYSGLLSRSAESNIEGVVGLEMFRHDLNQAGFGLPWGFSGSSPAQYQEADKAPGNSCNDSPNGIPRAFAAADNLTVSGVLNGTDYLVLKGTSLAANNASQRWTYVNYSSVGSLKPRIWSSGNLADNDRVIVLRRGFADSGYQNQLVYDNSDPNTFFTTYSKDGFSETQQAFSPSYPQETFFLYGVTPEGLDPRMPFNRSDYFIDRPAGIAQYCAKNTGVLYKSNVKHADGNLDKIPIMDCVADMQVVFGWDMNEDGVIDALSNANGDTVTGGNAAAVQNTMQNAAQLRTRLKVVKVYLMVQDGRRDPNFTNDKTIIVGNTDEKSLTKVYDVSKLDTNGWLNYRWKIYRIVVNPKNLLLK